ncbi:MAG: hypothetical protein BWX83_01125 [Candidatus Cloacimonetes bacterium ADurb.Bin117]|nr:MAG: hypothetical protein BWX83_01125 [Candidatus Cloacimonetes bacterium ADurb.Bin117]
MKGTSAISFSLGARKRSNCRAFLPLIFRMLSSTRTGSPIKNNWVCTRPFTMFCPCHLPPR